MANATTGASGWSEGCSNHKCRSTVNVRVWQNASSSSAQARRTKRLLWRVGLLRRLRAVRLFGHVTAVAGGDRHQVLLLLHREPQRSSIARDPISQYEPNVQRTWSQPNRRQEQFEQHYHCQHKPNGISARVQLDTIDARIGEKYWNVERFQGLRSHVNQSHCPWLRCSVSSRLDLRNARSFNGSGKSVKHTEWIK